MPTSAITILFKVIWLLVQKYLSARISQGEVYNSVSSLLGRENEMCKEQNVYYSVMTYISSSAMNACKIWFERNLIMVAIRAMAHQWPVALRPLCRPVQMNKSSKFHRLMSYHLLQEHWVPGYT